MSTSNPNSAQRMDSPAVELERIVGKMLEKERKRRYQGMGELLVDLKNVRDRSRSSVVSAPPPRPTKRKLIAPLLIVAAVAAAVLFGRDFDVQHLVTTPTTRPKCTTHSVGTQA